jgi:uncharacterized membrane protein
VVALGVDVLDGVLPIKKTPGGIAILIVLAVAALLALCFLAGVIARRTLGQRLLAWIEKQLLVLFPRYGIVKQQLGGSLGPDAGELLMQPVHVALDDHARLGFEVDRAADGPVTVYLPGSPDPWSGLVIQVESDRVTALDADFPGVIDVFERLGRGAAALRSAHGPTGDTTSS